MAKMIPTKINGKWDIILPEHRAGRKEWFTDEGWERARLDKMHEVIKSMDSPVVYYVGSEEAEMPALCQMWGAKVALFEPNEKVAGNAKAIWEHNNLEEPLAYFAAFAGHKNSSRPVDCDLAINELDNNVISNHGFKELHDSGEIPILSVDSVCQYIEVPTIISVDTEGSEAEVLAGAEKTLRKYRPVIFLSLHPEMMIMNYNKWSYELRRWLRDEIGYKETLLDWEHEGHFIYE